MNRNCLGYGLELPSQKHFDHTFGADFIKSVPHTAGVYEFLDESGRTIYVGKAKDLRKRLSQYRNTRIAEDNGKVRRMLKAAVELRFRICESDLAAQLLENELIQETKPKYNWAGTYYASYPCIGLKRVARHEWEICKTRTPEFFQADGYRLFGCYKRKDMVELAYEALSLLLGLTGRRQMMPHAWYIGLPKKSERCRFAHLDSCLLRPLEEWLLGRSDDLIGVMAGKLIEDENARRRSADVQDALTALRLFYRKESAITDAIRRATGHAQDFIPQAQRDRLQIIYRMQTS